MRIFILGSVVLRFVSVSAFLCISVYWFWIAFTDSEVAERGGFWFALFPLGLALISYVLFGWMVKWGKEHER